MPQNDPLPGGLSRRDLLITLARGAALGALVVGPGALLWKRVRAEELAASRWQIDPAKCTFCGRCATACVLKPSAVKAKHNFRICGYCDLCMGFFEDRQPPLTSGAEMERCPTGAIARKYIEAQRFEYTIDQDKCIGCAKCVKGCTTFANGSLYLQIDQKLCANCNECAIAVQCPGNAITRAPATAPYRPKETA